MKTTSIYLISIMLSASSTLGAQHTVNTLEEVWKLALGKNMENSVKQLKVEQALEDKRAAGSFLFPTISAAGNHQHNISISETPVPGELFGRPGETVYTQFGKEYSLSAGITVSYNPLGWKSIYQCKMAEVNVQLKRAEKDYFKQILKEQAGQCYFATLTAQQAIAIRIKDAAVADTLLMLTEQRFSEGTTDAMALNQARINRNALVQSLESARHYYNECISNLKMLIGLHACDELVLTETIANKNLLTVVSPPDPDSCYTAVYQLQERYADAGVKKALADFLPELSFTARLGVNQFQDDFSISFESEDWKPENVIGISLKMPIFSGFASTANYNSAKINRQIAARSSEDESRKSAINDSLLYLKAVSTSKIATAGLENFHLSSDNVTLAKQKYEQGLLSLDRYLAVFDDYLKTETIYLNNVSEFLITKASLESRK